MPEPKDSFSSRWIPLLLFLLASYLSGFVGWFAVERGLPFWYQTLNKPSWNPPSVILAPVWTILYGLVGIAGWLTWTEHDAAPRTRSAAIGLFCTTLLLNALWLWSFFGWERLGQGFAVICFLACAGLMTVVTMMFVKPKAGWLMLPYLGWAFFWMALCFAIWRLNP